MRTALYYIGIGLILGLFLNSSGPNLDTFIPGNPWEHYCKYELHKHPFHTNEKEYNEWLDANQYKLYPLLLDILKISLKGDFHNYSNTSNIHYEGGRFPSMLTIQLFNLEF